MVRMLTSLEGLSWSLSTKKKKKKNSHSIGKWLIVLLFITWLNNKWQLSKALGTSTIGLDFDDFSLWQRIHMQACN